MMSVTFLLAPTASLVWVGVQKARLGDTWHWIKNNQEVDAELWDQAFPQARPNADCAYLHPSHYGPLATYPCTNAYTFLCMYQQQA